MTIAGLGGLIYWIVRNRQIALQRKIDEADALAEQIRSALPKVFAAIVRPNRACLARRRDELLRRDANGTIVMSRWLAELSRFYQAEVMPELKHHFLTVGQPGLVLDLGDEAAFLDWFLKSDPLKGAEGEEAQSPPEPDMGPTEFERWCNRALCRAGWNSRLVPEGEGRPSTILAEKDDVTLAVQCRLDARPVGIKAVQEAAAARDQHLSQTAAVVSSQPFAPSALALARQQGVSLLHYDELEELDPKSLRGVAPLSPLPEAEPEPEPEAASGRANGPVPVFGRR